ncbi:MAG: hypothetical protein WA715_10435 [Candidatus Acidiferrum sp.]
MERPSLNAAGKSALEATVSSNSWRTAAESHPFDESASAVQKKFADLFRLIDQPRLEAWLQRANTGAPLESGLDDEPSEVQLQSGAKVRLRAIALTGVPGDALAAVALERVAVPESDSQNG